MPTALSGPLSAPVSSVPKTTTTPPQELALVLLDEEDPAVKKDSFVADMTYGSPSGRVASISPGDVPHVALLFKWAFLVGTSSTASSLRRRVSLFVLMSGVLLCPQVAVNDPHSFLYGHRNTGFGYIWMVLNAFAAYAVIAVFRNQSKSLCESIEYAPNGDISAGHLLRVLAELDLDRDESCWVRRWLIYVCPVFFFLAALFSLQGLAWILWIADTWSESVVEGVIWLWYYMMYLPLAALNVVCFAVSLGVSCAAAKAHVRRLEETLTSDASSVRTRCADAIDLLGDLNRNVLSATERGFGESVAVMVSAGVAIGMGFLYKCFRFNEVASAGFNNSTTTSNSTVTNSGVHESYTKGMLLQDFLTGALYVTLAQFTLLGAAKTSSGCDALVGAINEMRITQRQSESNALAQGSPADGRTPRGRLKAGFVPDSELAQIEALIGYIANANAGRGMGFTVSGVRLSTPVIKNSMRLMLTGFTYGYAQLMGS